MPDLSKADEFVVASLLAADQQKEARAEGAVLVTEMIFANHVARPDLKLIFDAAVLEARSMLETEVRLVFNVMRGHGYSGTATLARYPASTTNLPPAIERLEELRRLPQNWNGRGAEAPNDAAIRAAVSVVVRLDRRPASRIVASASGGITLYFFRDGETDGHAARRFASIDCLNTGERIAMLSDRAGGPPDVWEIDAGGLVDAITKSQRFLDS